MTLEFKLADLGEGVQEGEIVRWLVQAGDQVRSEQPLVEVMTDKVTAELPSPVEGTVTRLIGQPGEVVPVGATLVVLETADAGTAPQPPAATQGVSPSGSTEVTVPSGVLAVPAVRKLARELGVDLATVSGSGEGGRISAADVRAATGASTQEGVAAETTGPATTVRRVPLRGMRRVIAQHMLESHLSTAPYTFVEEVDFTELVRLRERVQPLSLRAGVKMTYLPFVIAAVSMALKEFPNLNATFDPPTGDLLVSSAQHIGIAVHTDEGLIVPVVRHVEQANLLDLAREIERLSQSARAGKLTREQMLGGTFTITSLGAMGGVMGTPMLNTPQVAVMGIHRIAERPVVRNGAVVARQTANLSLTLDHRYIDGFVGATFAAAVKGYLEDPALMLFWLAELRTE